MNADGFFFDPTLEVALNERRWVFYGEEPGVPYQSNVEVEVAQFLDCDGVTPDQQGKFNLFQHDPDILEHYVTKVNPDPTSFIRLLKHLHPSSTHENIDHEVNAHSAILRAEAAKVANPTYNLWMLESASLNANAQVRPKVRRSKKSRKKERRSEAFYRTPAIMDSGASYGLTPFRDDFITYEEVDLKVKDVSSENRVTGFGLVLYRMQAKNGSTCYVPGLAYHLETTDVRLISPQAYHQMFKGFSLLDGASFDVHLDKPVNHDHDVENVIGIPIDKMNNLPMIHDVWCSQEEKDNIGPYFTRAYSVLQRSMNGFFFGGEGRWLTTRLETEDFPEPMEVDYDFGLFDHLLVSKCVTTESNDNLSAAQRELLLWHFKLGCSMKKVQALMTGHTREVENGGKVWYAPVIQPKKATAANCVIPKCATCEIARAKVKKPKSKTVKAIAENEGALSKDKYMPGDFVSMDTVSVPIKGRLFTGYGADSAKGYAGVTLFHDIGSGVIRVFPQVSMTAADSLLSKAKFEEFLWAEAGVTVKHYHSDGGVFTAKAFRNDCDEKKQTQTFSGVGAKFQNANAERSVQTLFWMCRSFMLHAALRWSSNGADDANLWPQALTYAEYLFNRTPSLKNGFSPLERLTSCQSDHRELLRAHVWGAPVYVLDSKLQDGKRLPAFSRRAKLGQFMGFSPEHSSMVGLVRHVGTGHMSAQYHTVFDDRFETVFGIGSEDEEVLDETVSKIWCDLFKSKDGSDLYVEPEYDADAKELLYDPPPLEAPWLTEEELREREDRLQDQIRRGEQQRIKYEAKFKPEQTEPPAIRVRFDEHPSILGPDVESEGDDEDVGAVCTGVDDSAIQKEDEDEEEKEYEAPASPNQEEDNSWSRRLRPRSSWKQRINVCSNSWQAAKSFTPFQMASLTSDEKKTLSDPSLSKYFGHYGLTLSQERQVPVEVKRASSKGLRYRQKFVRQAEIAEQHLRALKFEATTVEELLGSPLSRYIKLATNDCGYGGSIKELVCNYVSPWFLNAKTGLSAADHPSWDVAMSGDEAEQYWQAAKTEIATLESMNAWDVVDRSSVPEDQRVLPSLWVFRRKRLPDGTVRKHKGRFTVRGDKQVAGVDYNETWAPVCKWTTVRMMFILQLMLGLKSAAADVQAAFLHGTLPPGEQVFVEMPRGFKQAGKVLKLRKSLYGLKQAPRCFWEYLTKTMESCGLKQSEFDSCLFIGEKVIAVAYVDDILFWAKDENDITDVMVQLREKGLLLEKESDAAGFLGVDINVLETDAGGRPTKMELTQTGLIDRIITNLGLDGGREGGKFVPAGPKPLPKDEDGPACEEDFNVAAVVGQLLYLSGHSRPEIAYAVNCCARYMFCPRRSHELALKQIGRYLRRTRTRGLIIEPSENLLAIDAFPDADFAGMYGFERPDDPACVKSRTGFVINVANCPVLWKSQLQSKTALSTMEAEISALAHCCRELFPIMDLAKHLAEYFGLDPTTTTMNVSVHEDNSSALILAQTIPPEHKPRSKYFHLETVWFREEIVKRGIKLLKIDTKEQLGDIFTKGLPRVVFEYLRQKLCGW